MGTTRATFKKTQITSITRVCSSDDLLTEILGRLPAKSILRFKSVSKHWLLLLSHRHFTLLYDNRLISPGFFFGKIYVPFDVEKPSPCPFPSLSFNLDSRGIRILQSCNGLLLCCSDTRDCKYYVFNPTTNQFAVIPSVIDSQSVHIFIRCMGLAFHPTDCVHFKIVCIYQTTEYHNRKRWVHRIQVYSSETGEWTIAHETLSVNYCGMSLSQHGVYWNGTIYFSTFLRKVPFYFKLDTQQLQNLPFREQGYYCRYFGESRGHLHLVTTAYGENRLVLNVYEMLSDHSGWVLKYRVELHELVAAYPEMVSKYQIHVQFKVIDLVRGDEEEEDTFMLVRIPTKIIRYNVVDKSFKMVSDLSGTVDRGEQVYRYIESIGSF